MRKSAANLRHIGCVLAGFGATITFLKFPWRALGRLRLATGAGRCRPQRATKRASEWRSQQDAKESHAGQTREATSSQTEYGHPWLARPPIEQRRRRISPASIAALQDQARHNQEMPNGEGSTAACVETPTLWSVDCRVARDGPVGENWGIKSPATL